MAKVNGTSQLLGTNKLQDEIDAFRSTIHETTTALKGINADLKQSQSHMASGGGAGNGIIGAAIGYAAGRWGGGSGGNGGGATFGGTGTSTPTTTGGRSNGGGASFGTQVASAAMGGMSGLANRITGDDQAMTKTQVNTAVQLMQRTGSGAMSNDAITKMMGRQAGFSSWGDAAGFAQTMQYSVGQNPGSMAWRRSLGGVSAMATLDPTITGARMGNFNSYINTFSAQNTLGAMGYNTRSGSNAVSPQQLADQLLKDPRIGGVSSIRTGADVDLILSDRGNLGASINNMVRNGLDPGAANTLRSMLRSKLVAKLSGVGTDQFNKNMSAMSDPNMSSAQRNKIAKSMGMSPTDSTLLEQGAASSRAAEAGTFQGFSAGLQNGVKQLEDFNKVLQGINDSPIGRLLGETKGVGSVLGGPMGMLTKGVGSLVGSLFGGAVGSSWSNSGGGQSGQPISSANGTLATGQGMSGVGAVNNALAEIGVPYVMGGTSTNGFDCSGLMQFAFAKIGVKLPRTSQQQQQVGVEIPLNKVQPGDLVFIGKPAHHVAMISRPGVIVEAPHTGASVRERPFVISEWTNARRITGSVGSTNDIRSSPTNNTSVGTQSGGPGALGGIENMLATEWDRLQSALSNNNSTVGNNSMSSGNGRPSQASQDNAGGGQSPPSNASSTAILKQAGFSGQGLAMAYAISMAESGENRLSHNTNAATGDNSYGWFQINMLGAMGPERRAAYHLSSNNDLFDPLTNSKVAYQMSKGGTDWHDWSTYTSGAYKKYLGGANKGYAVGSWNIDVDQTARVHAGEMILPASQAEAVRQVLAGNNPIKPLGGGGGVQITFSEGSIVITGTGFSSAEAQNFGKTIVDTITKDTRIKNIRAGKIS